MKCPQKDKFNAKIVQAAERVCWQSARGIYSKTWTVAFYKYVCCKLAVEFYNKMGYIMSERS